MTDRFMSIGELSDATGVKPVTLRAWERRHGLLSPQRTEGGHRLYGQEDVRRIAVICSWLEQGVSVGRVATLLEQDHENPETLDLSAAVRACIQLNGRHLEQLFNEESRERPLTSLYQGWIVPLRSELRQLGLSGHVGLAFCDRFLGQKLAARILKESRRVKQTARLLLQSVPGEDGHLVASVCQLMALERGWSSLLLCLPVGAHALAQSVVTESLQARVLVMVPGSRMSDLKLACRGSERLDIPHLLLDSGHPDRLSSDQSAQWRERFADPAAVMNWLAREIML